MRVTCLSNKGSDLPKWARLFETDHTLFSGLLVGESYSVYAIMFRFNEIEFLVVPSGSNPMWLPSHLFRITDDSLPPSWRLCLTYAAEGYKELLDTFKVIALIGYNALVTNYEHYNGIIERRATELAIFYSEKSKIDSEIGV
jgi:hypothetical protein